MSAQKGLSIAPGFALPTETVTQTVAILARKRSGKSFLARRLAEQLYRADLQIVVVDPKGDWWGMRSTADGKGPGLSVIILGGEHGDIPLEVGGGEIVAKLVVEERASILLDLAMFRKHEVATFMTAFLENLYRLKAREANRTPVMLIVDEADAIAPQKPQHGEERMLGAMEDIVRRGGQRGVGCTFVTQRSAVLNKNVLTQAQMLVALRTIAPQDLAALDAWIEVHGTPEQRATLMASLPALPQGDAWFWSPGWPDDDGIFRRVHVSRITTFDSGATPKPGERRVEPKKRAEIDLEVLRRQMADTMAKAKADDPRELRRRIADLEKKLKPSEASQKIAWSMAAAEQTFRREGFAQGKAAALAQTQKVLERIDDAISAAMSTLVGAIESAPLPSTPARQALPAAPEVPVHARVPESRTTAHHGGDPRLPDGERRILTVCAQYPRGATRDQLSVLTGYKRSSRDTYLQRLQAKGYIMNGPAITATSDGVSALGADFEPLPTGAALLAYWRQRLPDGERKIFDVLVRHYPSPVMRDHLDVETGYKRSSRDTYLQRLRSRRLVEIDGPALRASAEVFE